MSKFRYVWRLEDAKGRGVYRGCNKQGKHYITLLNDDAGVRYSSPRHPSPFDTGEYEYFRKIIDSIHNYYFGFATIKQYRTWMYKKEWRIKLSELGIKLNKYKVPVKSFVSSQKQALFIKSKSKLVASMKPSYRDI